MKRSLASPSSWDLQLQTRQIQTEIASKMLLSRAILSKHQTRTPIILIVILRCKMWFGSPFWPLTLNLPTTRLQFRLLHPMSESLSVSLADGSYVHSGWKFVVEREETTMPVQISMSPNSYMLLQGQDLLQDAYLEFNFDSSIIRVAKRIDNGGGKDTKKSEWWRWLLVSIGSFISACGGIKLFFHAQRIDEEEYAYLLEGPPGCCGCKCTAECFLMCLFYDKEKKEKLLLRSGDNYYDDWSEDKNVEPSAPAISNAYADAKDRKHRSMSFN
mmetsp:Transcript_4993/g.7718  ORF Transcript_4993/g.7718 Transcript_4993/m.7718 type:complete len:272 (-) Transcript_4993:142-957(-)